MMVLFLVVAVLLVFVDIYTPLGDDEYNDDASNRANESSMSDMNKTHRRRRIKINSVFVVAF